MLVIPRLKKKTIVAMSVIYFLLIILSIMKNVPVLLVACLMLWVLELMFTINSISNHVAQFCFLISFFVFLLGREVCFSYLNVEVYYKYLTGENNFAFICIIIALLGFGVGGIVKKSHHYKKKRNVFNNVRYIQSFQIVSKYSFYFCYIFMIIAVFLQIRFVQRMGYLASYTEDAGSAGVPSLISYIGTFTPVVLCFFLATYPKKEECKVPIILYEFYAVLTILTGKRYPFVAITMLLLIYFVLRNKREKGWITKRMIIAIVVAIPVLLFFLSIYDAIRVGEKVTVSGFVSPIIGFFDSQGGSINVIKRVAYYSDKLQDMKLCSFDNTRSLLFENAIIRKLSNVTVYTGNSIEHALKGHSLAHRLSYYNYGNGYLAGMGVGSCYIAELYHDFGYLGVFIGSIAYGVLVERISKIDFNHFFIDGLLLAIMYYLMLAPRGGFDGFVGGVFGIYSILGMVFLISFSYLISNRSGKKLTLKN